MSDKTGKPIDYFNAAEAEKLLTIALKWNPKEIEKLEMAVRSGFERILAAIQSSDEMVDIVWEIIGEGKKEYDWNFTPQEIIKIRNGVLNLLRPRNDSNEKENGEQNASPELARIGAVIQGLYTNWTYFSNTKVLAQSVGDFCKKWIEMSMTDVEESNWKGVTIKTKTFSKDSDDEDDDYDEDFWDDNDEISPGDIAIIKVIPDILQAYLHYLNRYPQSGIAEVLKDERELGRWQDIRSVSTDMKCLLMHTKLARKFRNSISYNFDVDARQVINELDSYSLFLPNE